MLAGLEVDELAGYGVTRASRSQELQASGVGGGGQQAQNREADGGFARVCWVPSD